MEEHHSVTSLMIVVLASFFVPIVLHRLKLKWIPVVVAEIILGMVLGKSGFQLIQRRTSCWNSCPCWGSSI